MYAGPGSNSVPSHYLRLEQEGPGAPVQFTTANTTRCDLRALICGCSLQGADRTKEATVRQVLAVRVDAIQQGAVFTFLGRGRIATFGARGL